jgi:succinyl-diaminopimelate desuccinylase
MDYVRVLSDFIAIDTVVPPGNNYRTAMQYLEPLFRKVGFETRLVEIPPEHAEGQTGRVNLVCEKRSQGKPRLIFYGHADVVPAAGWDAFNARVSGGRLYGRGAADMKGGIVGLLGALEAVHGKDLKFDIGVCITTDEEQSQASQLRYLANFLKPVEGSYVFCLDSSFGFVSVTGLGALHLDIIVKGKSVHSGLSHLGVNAVENAALLVQALLELKKKVVQRESRIEAHPDTGLKRMQARLNINMIQGGLKVNIVPDRCVIVVDRRLIPEETMADAEKEIVDCLSSVPGVNWEIGKTVKIASSPPCEGPMVDELAETIRQVTGSTGKFGEMGSGDLTNVVVNDWKGQSFGLGVIRPDCSIHGMDEFVYLKDIEDLGRIIARFIAQ